MAASKRFWRWTLVPVVAMAVVVPSHGDAAQSTRVLAETGTGMSATAPCSGRADVTVRVGAPEPDSVRVVVRDARPGTRWELTVYQFHRNNAAVTLYPKQIANERGRWRTGESALYTGYITVEVTARARAGQVCALSLSGRVSRL
jgi:hypothetical protein